MKTLHSIDSFGISEVSLNSIRVERLEQRVHPKVAFPHKHDFYQLILITEGKGLHEIDFRKHKVEKSQLYILKPGQIHTWSLSSSIRGIIIEFSNNSVTSDLITEIDYTPDVLNLKKDPQMIQDLAGLMLREFQVVQKFGDKSLKSLLSSLLTHILRLTGTKKVQKIKQDLILEKFRELVEENFKFHHRVEFYAKNLRLTPKALTMKISRSLGRPPRLIIQDRFLLEAKRYLAYSDLSIAEVGYEIGFDDANYFSRFFKLHEKMTPAQFKKKSLIQRE